MLQRPRFKPHYHVEVVENEGVFLLSETHQTVLQGWLYELIAPRLDGRPVEALCEELRGAALPSQVFYTIGQLEKKGYITERDDTFSREEASLWSIQHIDPAAAAVRLAETPLALTSFGGLDVATFRALLESLHVRVGETGGLGVVVTDHYLREELDAYNREALDRDRPWLLIKPVGCQVWVGPVFRPGTTGCWRCLAHRLRANLPIVSYLDETRGVSEVAGINRAFTPATLSAAWGLAATAVASWIARDGSSPLEGKIQTLDLLTWKSQTHTLVRQLSCAACGEKPDLERASRPVILESRKKRYTEDGGHRTVSSKETLDRYSHHVSPISGVVPLLERSHASKNGVIHVYHSGNNIARAPRSWMSLRRDLRNSSAGKGTNEVQAQASALCEGIERYSAIFRGDEPRRKASLSALGDEAIHPNACMLISARQYRDRESWNQEHAIFHYIPAPFDPDQEVDWTPVWSLTRRHWRLLPTAFCYFCYPQEGAEDYCVGCSNGNAAGNTLEEAILQGFLELVERDSVALWWYNRLRMPAVDVDSFGDPYLEQLRNCLADHQRALWVLDLTADLGIPVFAALARRTDGTPEQILFGFGCHLDPRTALLRAVTELNQMLVHILDSRTGEHASSPLTDPETLHWLQTATLENQPYLVPADIPPRPASSYPRLWTDDLRDDVLLCQAKVEALGLEMLVLDQTRPDVGMPVVKVIVPGLRHFWTRFAPGRLYDVPVALGRLPRTLPEEELNPIPMFL